MKINPVLAIAAIVSLIGGLFILFHAEAPGWDQHQTRWELLGGGMIAFFIVLIIIAFVKWPAGK